MRGADGTVRVDPGAWVLLASAVVALLVVAGVLLLRADPRAAASDIDAELLEDLREGGLVLLMRHALSDTSQTDADPTARGGCAQQRNLSAEGRAQAVSIGQAMHDLGLPVGPVHASPFCRALDTARAIDADAEPTDALLSLTAVRGPEAIGRLTDDGRALIAAELGGSGVAVLVTHTQNIEALTGRQIEEGDALVLAGGPAGGIEVRAIIRAADW